jgi:hypothetical protein
VIMAEDLTLNGTFKEKAFPQLLVDIHKWGRTGILLAQKGEIVKRVFFQDGEPIASRSNVRKELLGEILCARGKISRAQLDEVILESNKDSGDNFGQIITKKGMLSQDELYANSKYQFISILFSLFSWEEGTYSFEDEEPSGLIPPGFPRFHVKFSKLLSEGLRLVKKEGIIDRIVGRTNQVIRFADLPYESGELSFQGEDRGVFEALAEGMTIQELMGSVSLDPLMVKKILYAFSSLEIIRIQAPVEPGEEKEKKEMKEAAVPPTEPVQEEIPALDQSSLASVMDELMPEEAAAEEGLPSFHEETEPLETAEFPLEETEEGFATPSEEGAEEEESPEVLDIIQSAVEEAGEVPPEEAAEEAPAEEEETFGEEIAPIEEEIITPSMEEQGMPQAEGEAEEIPHEREEDVTASVEAKTEVGAEEKALLPEKEEEEEKEPLTAAEEAVLADVVEKAAGEIPGEREGEVKEAEQEKEAAPLKVVKKKKSKIPVLVGSVLAVAVIAFGGMIWFYKMNVGEFLGEFLPGFPAIHKEQPTAKPVETLTPKNILQQPATENATPEVPQQAPPAAAQGAGETAPETVTESATESTPPSSEKAPPAEVAETKAPPSQEPLENWEKNYSAGLASFNTGNLESAFKSWSDVIRNAPDDAYSIQIELTSYINYAARDIKEGGGDHKIFVVETTLNDKPVYKVLCGIYPDKEAAQAAFQDLSSYLKAQKPSIVPMRRLKARLIESPQ